MRQYQELLEKVLSEGVNQSDRTGVGTISIAGAMLKFDLTKGFPVVTTRRYPWKAPIAEQTCFIKGKTSAKDFRDAGCKFWDANAAAPAWQANPHCLGEDDLGEIYGVQARRWLTHDGYHDQFFSVLRELISTPTSRRLLVSHWRPDRFDRMALPPCHVSYQFIASPSTKELNLVLYMRSNDLFLGAPANIVEYAWLLEVVAHATGYVAKELTYMIADAHIYTNHVDQVSEVLSRVPFSLPTLVFNKVYEGDKSNPLEVLHYLESLNVSDFSLTGYASHEALTAPMAV